MCLEESLFHSAQLPLMLTVKAKSAQITLVYLYLFAVALLCCYMLWYSFTGQCRSNLLHWSAPRYALLTFADNTELCQGFYIIYYIYIYIYIYICSLNVSLHRIIISIHFPLIYAIWWPVTHSDISLYEWMTDARFPFRSTSSNYAIILIGRYIYFVNIINTSAMAKTLKRF